MLTARVVSVLASDTSWKMAQDYKPYLLFQTGKNCISMLGLGLRSGLGLRVGLGSGTGLVLGYELYVCKAVKGTPVGKREATILLYYRYCQRSAQSTWRTK